MKIIYSLVFIITLTILGSCQEKQMSSVAENASELADSLRIVDHLTKITKTEGFRNYENVPLLDQTAAYIFSVFSRYADTTYYQPYEVNGNTYKNVVCRFGKGDKPVIVVGAHYDVCGEQEGADDNASGIVGLLELARLFHGKSLSYPVEVVAYSLEEPPYFRTEQMGSYIHAQSLKNNNVPVYGMVVLEMIGFFKEEKNTQTYPIKAMKVAYGTTGNYILLAKRSGAGEFVKGFSEKFEDFATIQTETLTAPAKLQGMDFSDHLNYWKFGFDALMVTNTAFYRNPNYHRPTDTMETLDIQKMMKVINTTYLAIAGL